MLQRTARPPAQILARVLGVIIGGIVLGLVLFTPISRRFVFPLVQGFMFTSLVFLLVLGIASLVVLWKRGLPQLHQGLLILALGLLVLYGALILWPAYESGLAWYTADPKGSEEFETYHAWYSRQVLDPTLFDIMTFVLVLATVFASWYLLLPLGIALAISMCWRWSEMNARGRWITVGASVMAIAVPPLTWIASHQFMRWFID
jgi:hypothetical protein